VRGQHLESLKDDVDHFVRPCFVRLVGDVRPKLPQILLGQAETADSASGLPGTDLSTVGFDSGRKATGGRLVVKCSLLLCELSETGLNIGTESNALLVALVEKPQCLANDFTGRLVHPAVDFFANELFQFRCE